LAQMDSYRLWSKHLPDGAPFTVCAMFTPGFQPQAERLRASLEQLGLAYLLFEVDQIHRSISTNGGQDITTSKPVFIRMALERCGGAVLYVDADTVFRKAPDLISDLCAKQCDFAIYNWFADDLNDAWRPDEAGVWRFYLSVDLASETQLMASGAVQLWSNSNRAGALLAEWQRRIAENPASPDDQCLDFAFNHGAHPGLNAAWLPKEYCRYAFWPYVEPVIDHPELPSSARDKWKDLGHARVNFSQIRRARKTHPLPREMALNFHEVSARPNSTISHGEKVD